MIEKFEVGPGEEWVDGRSFMLILEQLLNILEATKGEPWFPDTDKFKARVEAQKVLREMGLISPR